MRRRPWRIAAVAVAALVGGYGGWHAAPIVADARVPVAQPATAVDTGTPPTPDTVADIAAGALDEPVAQSERASPDHRVRDSWLALTDDGPVMDRPARISVPSIEVAAPLMPLGLEPDGSLEVPSDFDVAGWWAGGAQPGADGPAVVVGHVDSHTGPAVFHNLDQLGPGDQVAIHAEAGSAVRFEVTRVEQHRKDEFPTEDVYGDTLGPTLRLVTCGGPFNENQRQYQDNIIVYAQALPPTSERGASPK